MSRARTLVDAEWVHRHLDDPHVVLIEVDEDTAAYDTNHIRGALRIDWRLDLQDPVRRDFVDQDGFEKLLSRKGVKREDTVILYGGNNNWFAAFAYWYFKVYGHEDVRLLDGGRKKWELDSRELVREVPTRRPTTYKASAPNSSLRALRDDVLAAIGSLNLVDVRSPEEFSGKLSAPAHLIQEAALQRGHIPTAVNVPWSKAANDDGTFRSDDELASLYGILDSGRETIVYCRIGERSAHTWFVLSEVLGYENVRNYDGSWAEYGSLVGVPITLLTENGT
ncbi:sulfurtransferase [Streptomyces sp. NPDC059224]|uniref:sulfurtransferase n=1 Tax=Streptomyces sp. NPDC059224 TaxID=3346775 RepID=UPI00369F80B2